MSDGELSRSSKSPDKADIGARLSGQLPAMVGASLSSLRCFQEDRVHSFQIVCRSHDLPLAGNVFIAAQRELTKSVNALDVSESRFNRRFALSVDCAPVFGLQSMPHAFARSCAVVQPRWFTKAPKAAGMAFASDADVGRDLMMFTNLNITCAEVARIGQKFVHSTELLRQID